MSPSLHSMETQHSYCVPRVCAPKKHDHEQQCVRNSMCPRLPGPLDRMRSEKPRIKRERKKLLDFVISGIINSSLLFSDPAELQRWMKFISCGYKKSIKNGCCKTKN